MDKIAKGTRFVNTKYKGKRQSVFGDTRLDGDGEPEILVSTPGSGIPDAWYGMNVVEFYLKTGSWKFLDKEGNPKEIEAPAQETLVKLEINCN